MCNPFSCVVHKTKGVLRPKSSNEHSHRVIIEQHGLPDRDKDVSKRSFVRIELTPPNRDVSFTAFKNTPVAQWTLKVDEKGTLPRWYTSQERKWDTAVRKAAQDWLTECLTVKPVDNSKTITDLEKKMGNLRTRLDKVRKPIRTVRETQTKLLRRNTDKKVNDLRKKMTVTQKERDRKIQEIGKTYGLRINKLYQAIDLENRECDRVVNKLHCTKYPKSVTSLESELSTLSNKRNELLMSERKPASLMGLPGY